MSEASEFQIKVGCTACQKRAKRMAMAKEAVLGVMVLAIIAVAVIAVFLGGRASVTTDVAQRECEAQHWRMMYDSEKLIAEHQRGADEARRTRDDAEAWLQRNGVR